MSAVSTAPALSGVSFGGILRSELIKLTSLRSTIWCYIILIVITIGLAPLLGLAFASQDMASLGLGDAQNLTVQAITASIGFSQLVVSVLGALVITGEYGTGMIRSTFTAVPKRLPALYGKAVVFGLTTFVIGFVALSLSLLVTTPVLAAGGIEVDLADGALWLSVLGAAAYLALIGLLSLAIGAIIRNSAGGIATALGTILVLPTILSVFVLITMADWLGNLNNVLPSNAGTQMFTYQSGDSAAADPFATGTALEPWQGGLVLVLWVLVLGALASVLIKRRDA